MNTCMPPMIKEKLMKQIVEKKIWNKRNTSKIVLKLEPSFVLALTLRSGKQKQSPDFYYPSLSISTININYNKI